MRKWAPPNDITSWYRFTPVGFMMSQAILGSGRRNAEGLSLAPDEKGCFHLCSVQPHLSVDEQTGSDAEACSAAPDPCGQPTFSALNN